MGTENQIRTLSMVDNIFNIKSEAIIIFVINENEVNVRANTGMSNPRIP